MLVGTIAQGAWAIGERLPAERILASEFGVSRNTLRSVLKRLEARGMVRIRKGSGCYLTALEPRASIETLAGEDSMAILMARFEAAYLCLPELVALAARRMEPMSLRTLESAVSHIGQAIVERDMDRIKDKSGEFFDIIAESTDNPVIGEVVRLLYASASVMFPRFFSFDEEVRNEIFGDFVHILRALQSGNPDAARRATRRKIVNTATAFSKLRQVPLSSVFAADSDAEAGIAPEERP